MKRLILGMLLVVGCGEETGGGPAVATASLSCDGADTQDARISGHTWANANGSTWDFGPVYLTTNAPGSQPRSLLWCAGSGKLKVEGLDDLTPHVWDYAFDSDALVIAQTYRLTTR